MLADKNREPADDILSRLAARVRSGVVSEHNALTTAIAILIAGHETTSNMIALGTLTLLTHPEQAESLRQDPDLAPNAVEELLRYLSVAEGVAARVAIDDFPLGRQRIHAGDGIVMLIPTANRDPAAFPQPNELDLRRTGRHHLAFGHGLHQCIGQHLARMELEVTYPTLLRRIPTLRPAVPMSELTFRHDDGVHGVRSLPIIWDS